MWQPAKCKGYDNSHAQLKQVLLSFNSLPLDVHRVFSRNPLRFDPRIHDNVEHGDKTQSQES